MNCVVPETEQIIPHHNKPDPASPMCSRSLDDIAAQQLGSEHAGSFVYRGIDIDDDFFWLLDHDCNHCANVVVHDAAFHNQSVERPSVLSIQV